MTKFKVGDKVRISPDSWHEECRKRITYIESIDDNGDYWVKDPCGDYSPGLCQGGEELEPVPKKATSKKVSPKSSDDRGIELATPDSQTIAELKAKVEVLESVVTRLLEKL